MKTQSRRRLLVGFSAMLATAVAPARSPSRVVVGTYNDKRLWEVKKLTFPRVLVYSSDGKLIPRESWPTELTAVKESAGDAFCCVSDKPAPPGWSGPPPDCKVVVYGEDINEHFDGLQTVDGRPITLNALPPHRFLVIEYYASWCAPCRPAREALLSFLEHPESESFAAVVVDFSRRTGRRPSAA